MNFLIMSFGFEDIKKGSQYPCGTELIKTAFSSIQYKGTLRNIFQAFLSTIFLMKINGLVRSSWSCLSSKNIARSLLRMVVDDFYTFLPHLKFYRQRQNLGQIKDRNVHLGLCKSQMIIFQVFRMIEKIFYSRYILIEYQRIHLVF